MSPVIRGRRPGELPPTGDIPDRGSAAAAGADVLDSHWAVLRELLPDLLRLLRALATDRRVPLRAKLVAGAALGYALLPGGRVPAVVPGTPVGLDDLVAVVFAVRHLVAAAGFEVVRELWTGTDAGFGMLVVLAGVSR